MGDGVVLERGKHEELLSNESGPYTRLVAAQRLRETREGIDMDDVMGQPSCDAVKGDADIEEVALEGSPLDRSKSHRSLASEIFERRKAEGPKNREMEYSLFYLFVRMSKINKGRWKSYLFGCLFAIGEYSNFVGLSAFLTGSFQLLDASFQHSVSSGVRPMTLLLSWCGILTISSLE